MKKEFLKAAYITIDEGNLEDRIAVVEQGSSSEQHTEHTGRRSG